MATFFYTWLANSYNLIKDVSGLERAVVEVFADEVSRDKALGPLGAGHKHEFIRTTKTNFDWSLIDLYSLCIGHSLREAGFQRVAAAWLRPIAMSHHEKFRTYSVVIARAQYTLVGSNWTAKLPAWMSGEIDPSTVDETCRWLNEHLRP
jgi:hypothetical protein